ncbi:hypothetical protein A2382_00345 [Candidatus Woesebacteria bacterium RIFOXYB1_FULL_38_16]|uniref:Uncharacterized protein n=1 Tax=Candidatus Woesebacteria bacterium RIFOXYB1_FULL_38_16 TaxID=1802538 RepID=A0A1F8CSF0_9BACT|nr:MAG: hypothetical protein A2191_01130 [Candidatus Woesebacteria bacterium RIFOXYA1_FULL_38_9]OGM79220.1 MAG: hypothetical protein A2382_00345 [Candidatus Woesebacteria bacterium RIFOXYB1_FULL_38_16]
MRQIKNLDKFYIVFALVFMTLAFLVIVIVKGIFSAVSVAREVDSELVESLTPRLNESGLEESARLLREKKIDSLDLGR